MARYTTAEAKRDWDGLLNKALAGEKVIITRWGKPVVEIKPIVDLEERSGEDDESDFERRG